LCIESILAIPELEEIVFAMRSRIDGLSAGRWNFV
jgi:malate synthase